MKTMVQIVQHLIPGGIEKLVIDLLRFHTPDTQVYIIALEGNAEDCLKKWPELSEFKGKIFFLNKLPGFQFSTLKMLISILRDLSADVIHTHHIGPLLYGGLAARLLNIERHLHTEHDVWHLNEPKQLWLTKTMLKLNSTIIVADAEEVATKLCDLLKYDDVNVILNGIDVEKFVPGKLQSSKTYNNFVVGCAARLVVEKSLDRLIQSVAKLDSVNLVIAGEGPEELNLKGLVEELGLRSRVKFIGYTDDIVDFYHSLDLFVLPSENEGLPLSVLEAQACNIPVVCSDVGAVREGVCPKTGVLLQDRSVESFMQAIKQQMEATPETEPRSFVEKNCDIRHVVKAYNKLIEG